MAPKITLMSLENRISFCQEYAELWQTFFQMFSDLNEDSEVTPEMESEFENIVTILSVNHFKFTQMCGDNMRGSDEVLDILCDVPNLLWIRNLAEANRSKLDINWHTAFINMNKALGKMWASLPPKRLEALQAAQEAGEEMQVK
ncbi:MAG: hypothetical protein JJU11_16400 [Candidatus Sumerlaeia bacterium]|nr:hypothetical protein [Candidatus Sumerlaeia bacterium]